MLKFHLHSLPCAAAEPDLPGSAGSGPAAPVGAGGPAQLDAVALGRLMALDPNDESQLIERVMKAFQTSAVRLTAQLDDAQQDAARETLRRVAHTLKSSSASIGALDLSLLCARLETGPAGESGPAGDTRAEFEADRAALYQSLADALAAIERLLAQRRG